MSTPLAFLVGFALPFAAYALGWLGARLLDRWTKPAQRGQ